MTAPISPGSSGGPVLNGKGEVIGVSVAAHRDLDAQNLNFAIPSNYLKNLLTLSKPAKPLSQANQTISAETYFLRGNACYDLGLYDLAIANYDKAIQRKPIMLTHIITGELRSANSVSTLRLSVIMIKQYNLNLMLPTHTTTGESRRHVSINTLQLSVILTKPYNANPIMPAHTTTEEL